MTTYLEAHADLASSELGPGVHASITMRHHGATVRVASSSPRAAACDAAEARAEDGPCVAAMTAMEPVRVRDVGAETRWGAWTTAAHDAGFAGVVAVPARVDGATAVSLNLYLEPDRDWSESDTGLARRLAGTIRAAVHARLLAATSGPDGTADDAEDGARVVELAVGAIMQANGVDARAARALLEHVAARRGVPTPEAAAAVLAAVVGAGG